MKNSSLALIAVLTLSVAGCSTAQGIKQDFINLKSSIAAGVDEMNKNNQQQKQAMNNQDSVQTMPVKTKAVGISDCPNVMIDPMLDEMNEFKNMANPTPETRVSTFNLAGADTTCDIEGDYLSMRIDLNFHGHLGPKARIKPSDRPFFAYPYFVAVSDSAGNELAKEIFAASVSYEIGQDSIKLVETIRQRLPLDANGHVPAYQVSAGFQLTEDQLSYNTDQ